jgi:hypothetical protein
LRSWLPLSLGRRSKRIAKVTRAVARSDARVRLSLRAGTNASMPRRWHAGLMIAPRAGGPIVRAGDVVPVAFVIPVRDAGIKYEDRFARRRPVLAVVAGRTGVTRGRGPAEDARFYERSPQAVVLSRARLVLRAAPNKAA